MSAVQDIALGGPQPAGSQPKLTSPGQNLAPKIAVVLLIALLALAPMLQLVSTGIAPGGLLDLAAFVDRLQKPAVLRAAWRTLDTSLWGAVLALGLGASFAFAVALTDLPGRRIIGFLLLLPLVVAPQVTALAWLNLFGPSSTLLSVFGMQPAPGSPNPLLGRGGIILLFGVQHAPLVFITLRAGLSRIPAELIEAAQAAGARPLRIVFTVLLPLIRPWIIAAAALAFVSGVGNFGIPALLGMPVNYNTLPTLIYQRMSSFGPGVLPEMAALSVPIGGLVLAGILAQSLALRRAPARFAGGRRSSWNLGSWRLPAAILAWAIILAIVLAPIAALIATSLVPTFGVPLTSETATLSNYAEVLFRQDSTSRAFRNSILFAGGTAVALALVAIPVVIVLKGMGGRSRSLLLGATELPYAMPGIVLAIACILLFLRPLPVIGSLYATAWIILIAYAMSFLALALRPVMASADQIPDDLDEAAAASGASRLRRLATISAPLVAPAAMAGALLVFMSAFNELTLSALLWSAGNETLGVALFSLEEAGLSTLAAAVAVSTIVVVLVLLALLDRFARRLPPDVLPWR